MGVTNVAYNGFRLEPAPFIGISRVPTRTEGGVTIGSVVNVTLQGKLVAFRGSPNVAGNSAGSNAAHAAIETVDADARLAALSSKIEALYDLFATDGQKLEWISANGGSGGFCYPRVNNVTVDPDIWYNYADYNIQLEADNIFGDPALENLTNASESWTFAPDTIPDSFVVTHTISASAVALDGDSDAWETAKAWAVARMGYDATIATAYLGGAAPSAQYNYTVEESADEMAGSYSVTERWILFDEDYYETYTPSVTENIEDSDRTKTVTLRGTIQGFYEGLNNREQMYTNAQVGLTAIQALLQTRAETFITPAHFLSSTIDHNETDGTISYAYEYDNRDIDTNTYEVYSIERSWGHDDYKTTATINGTIFGRITQGEDLDQKFPRAETRWAIVEPLLYGRVGVAFQDNPISKSVTENPIEGTIQYSYAYNDRDVELYEETFTVSNSYSRADGLTTVVVNGTVQGYDSNLGDLTERYDNALVGMPSDATIFGRATSYGSSLVVGSPVTKELTYQPQAGAVGYSYTYTSEATGCYPGVLSLNVSVTEQKAGDVVALLDVIGRLQGPVLQPIGSKTAKVRRIDVEIVQNKPTSLCQITGAYSNKPEAFADEIINGLKPSAYAVYYTEPTDTYVITEGRYSASVSWLYES